MYLIHSIAKLVVLVIFWPLTLIIKSYTNYHTFKTLQQFKKDLRNTTTYEQWLGIVEQIDKFLGKDEWRKNYVSKKFDYRLISDRIVSLRHARDANDIGRIISLLNSSTIRNFGGITDKNLFNNSYMGTKFIIHEYIAEVLKSLEFIHQYDDANCAENDLIIYKLRAFHNAKQTLGNTALILQGGSMFGMYHLGVIKTLSKNNLLPKIISGSYFGSVFGCLICVSCLNNHRGSQNDFFDRFTDELIRFGLQHEPQVFDSKRESWLEFLLKFYHKTYTPEILLLMKYVEHYLEDLTFEELYSKTGKILNLIIHSTDKSLPTICNYITTPNMIVRSAMFASIGSDIMGDEISILVKNLKNEVVEWSEFNLFTRSSQTIIQDGNNNIFTISNEESVDSKTRFLGPHEINNEPKSPYERLTELFNVNHFIVSLARLYFKPLVINDIRHDLHFVRPLNDVDKIIEEAKEKRIQRKQKRADDNKSMITTPAISRISTIIDLIEFQKVADSLDDDEEVAIESDDDDDDDDDEEEGIEDSQNFLKDLTVNNPLEIWLLPVTILISLAVNLMINVTTLIATPSYTYINISKNIQKIINMEIQYRFNLLTDLEFFKSLRIFQLLKKLTVDEKTPKLSSSEITIVPNVWDFISIWKTIFIINDINEESITESIDSAIKFGEKSVWALLPILKVRCEVEFVLDDLYDDTKALREI
ncbi:bifunctional triglyceride lipase/lysophosphatidylethanolamine acyltransferase [Saccharomycopsis crataegensis]|uniref:Patatin-like phospholipase domain-containing protein n=1 Tax=Saccharomycopsis crataegensis TaxID=43959 RepID=A0AAV5QF13_9ASCO|nr:bifunctional triglyceride lipase/lysophosphatidylethanolamine acyltransferase [Saccharomycopsis crataegensis]